MIYLVSRKRQYQEEKVLSPGSRDKRGQKVSRRKKGGYLRSFEHEVSDIRDGGKTTKRWQNQIVELDGGKA